MSTICDTCGAELHVGDYPFCKGDPSKHQPANVGVVADDIPGGVEVRHGICHPDGTPRRYYTKSSMAAEAKRRGYVNVVQHVGGRGTDKSKHTQRFV